MPSVLCIYEGPDPLDRSQNAFEFAFPEDRSGPLLSDLQRSFPLGAHHGFTVFSAGGVFMDVANPAEPLPVRDGVVKAKVFALAAEPRISREAVRERAAGGPSTAPLPPPLPAAAPAARRGDRPPAFSNSSSSSSPPVPAFPGSSEASCRRGSGGGGDSSRGGGGGGGGESSGGGGGGRGPRDIAGLFDGDQQHRRQTSGGSAGSGGGSGGIGIESAGKAVFGLLSSVSRAAQGLAEQLTAQEIVVGSYRVQVVRLLAEGGFSKVSLAREASTGKVYALKEMLCGDRDAADAAQREVAVLRAVRHRNVIQLLDQTSFQSKRHPGAREFQLLFPYFERGTAWDAIVKAEESDGQWPFPEAAALRLFADACAGTLAMHNKGFAHRDIKPLNVLLAEDGTGILMDVGSACKARREVNTRQEALILEDEAAIHCSAPYRPPELTSVNTGVPIDERVDVWALGCTLFALAFGHSPFESPRDGVLKLAILNGKFSFPPGRRKAGNTYSPEFCELVQWLLQPDPALRTTLPPVIERVQGLIRR